MPIQYMTLNELRNLITCSGDLGDLSNHEQWLRMFQYKAEDSGMGHLVDSILRHGFDPTAPVEVYDGELSDGHHRLVAAFLTMTEPVPVLTEYEEVPCEAPLVCAHGCVDCENLGYDDTVQVGEWPIYLDI